ncbi:MAG: hypothetical protein SOU07_05945 [Bacilli bacterium]|nr:hypothetical protein [Acholeplasmataceae bacterium]MDY2902963.1 hypothetical protein [Bacilli bacterium]
MDNKFVKDIRKFGFISNLAFNIFVTILMGVGFGWLLDYFLDTNYWIVICSILFTIVAIINFIRMILKLIKMSDKEDVNVKKNK